MSDSPLLSILAILAVAGFVLGTILLALARAGRGPDDTLFVSILRVLASLLARAVHGFRPGEVRDPIPRSGACIIVSNHRSGVDPLIISIATKRRVRFLMAREFYEIPILVWIFRALGCIPVKRDGTDFAATKTAIAALHANEAIAIFPHGGIEAEGETLRVKDGIGLLALKTGASIVPLHLEGSPVARSVFGAHITRSRIRLRSGEPFRLEPTRHPTREEVRAATRTILAAMERAAVEGDRPF
jgi:1-acyl-sn-glycerol-3-phosphate acyltransferase